MVEYVKICGLKKPEEIELSINKGANAVGFIYNVFDSPRNLEKAEIVKLLNNISNKIFSVIVFKPESLQEIQITINEINAGLYQIHTNMEISELNPISADLKKKIILAYKLDNNNKDQVVNIVKTYFDQFFAFLIDNSEGQGNKLDLRVVKEVLDKCNGARIILAGGINVRNIKSIIKMLNPFGIDVSSSLESIKGIKDPKKIRKFLYKIKKVNKAKRE
ncbi:MAG TPA: phosphoribosylanthranilate isomerase [Candidatus Lokiarchaeia archaeon]